MKHKSIARLMIAGLILSAPLILPVTVAQPSSGNMSTPTTGGVNSVVLLPDREGDTGQITIFTSGGAIQLIQPLQEFSITNPLQPPAPPVILNPQQVQQLYGSTISSQPLPPQPPTPMPTLSPTHSLTPTYDATVFYALYMTALAEGVQKQDAIATAQAGAQATTQAQATATAPTATMTFTPSPTVEDVGQLPPVSPLTQTAEAQAATAEALALTPSTTNTLTPSPTVDVSQLPVIPWITMPEVLPEPLPQVVPVDAVPAQPPQEPPQQPMPADALPAEHLLTPTALLDTNRPEQIAVPQGAVDAPAELNSSKPTQTPTFTPTVTFTPSPRPTLTHTPIPSPTLPAAQRFATQQAAIDAAATRRADNWATQQIQLTTSPQPPQVLTELAVIMTQQAQMVMQQQARLNREVQFATAQAQTATAIALALTPPATSTLTPSPTVEDVVQLLPVPPQAQTATVQAQIVAMLFQTAQARYQVATAQAQTAIPLTRTAIVEMQALPPTEQAQLMQTMRAEWVTGMAQTATVVLQAATARVQTATAAAQTATAQPPVTRTAIAEMRSLEATAQAQLMQTMRAEWVTGMAQTATAQMQTVTAQVQTAMTQVPLTQTASAESIALTQTAIAEMLAPTRTAIAEIVALNSTEQAQLLQTKQAEILTEVALTRTMVAIKGATRQAEVATEEAQRLATIKAEMAPGQTLWAIQATQSAESMMTAQARTTRWAATATEQAQIIGATRAASATSQAQRLATLQAQMLATGQAQLVIQNIDSQGAIEGLAQQNPLNTMLTPTIPAVSVDTVVQPQDLMNTGKTLLAPTATLPGNLFSNADLSNGSPLLQALATALSRGESVSNAISTAYAAPAPSATPTRSQVVPVAPADQVASAIDNGATPPTTDEQLRITPTPTATPLQTMPLYPADQMATATALASGASPEQALINALAQGSSPEQALAVAQTAQALLTPTATPIRPEMVPIMSGDQLQATASARALLTPTATAQPAAAQALASGASPEEALATAAQAAAATARATLNPNGNPEMFGSDDPNNPHLNENLVTNPDATLKSRIATQVALSLTPTPTPSPTLTETPTPTPSPTPTETPTPTPSRAPLPSLTPSTTPTSDRQPNACDPGGTLAGKCSIGDPGFICPPDVTDCAGYSQMLWQSGYYLQQYEDGNLTYDQIPDTLKWVAPQPTPSGMGFCSVVIPEDERINLELPDPTLLIPLEVIYGLSDPNATYGSVLPYGLDWESTAAYGPILTVYGQVNAFDIWLSTVGWIETLVSIGCPNPTPPT